MSQPPTPGFYRVVTAGIHRKDIETQTYEWLRWTGKDWVYACGSVCDHRRVRRWEEPEALS